MRERETESRSYKESSSGTTELYFSGGLGSTTKAGLFACACVRAAQTLTPLMLLRLISLNMHKNNHSVLFYTYTQSTEGASQMHHTM